MGTVKKWSYFVIGEKDGQYTVKAVCGSEEEAEDASADPHDEFDILHITEEIQVVGA